MTHTAYRLVIIGRVQGVGFRAFVHRHANVLGLDGFVRNRADGTVEAIISGASANVEALIAKCRIGPSGSEVERIQVDETPQATQSGFLHLPTV